jgi:hypothetical protein
MIRVAAILVIGLLFSPGAQAVTYSNWLAGYPSVTNVALDGDQDRDGISNLTEFAMAGCDPTQVDSASALPRMVWGTRATNTVLPWNDPSVIVVTNTVTPPITSFFYLGLAYTPRTDAEGIRLRPQYAWWGSNLEAWLDGRSAFLAPLANGTNGEVITWMHGMFRPAAPPSKSWMRILVEVMP